MLKPFLMSTRTTGLAMSLLGALLSGCASVVSYTGTDKIDFANRTSLVVGPTAMATTSTASSSTAGARAAVGAGLFAEVGVLVDGRLGPNGPHVNDAGYLSSDARLPIPNRIARRFGDIFYPDRRQEIIAFTNDRRPAFVSAPWRNGEDIHAVAFQPRLGIPVTVWIVTGPFNQQRVHALEAILRTVSIWRAERAGFGFHEVRIHDATTDPQAADRDQVPGNPTEDDTWRPLREQIGFEPGRLNIYWVDTVNANTGTGWSNFGAQIAMGQQTGDELLVHEIGHALSLTHVNIPPLAGFDDTNIMHNASNRRAFVTEGQTVRMHMNPGSIVWTLAPDVGQASPRPRCERDVVSGVCPAIDRRIWPDGTFPANN